MGSLQTQPTLRLPTISYWFYKKCQFGGGSSVAPALEKPSKETENATQVLQRIIRTRASAEAVLLSSPDIEQKPNIKQKRKSSRRTGRPRRNAKTMCTSGEIPRTRWRLRNRVAAAAAAADQNLRRTPTRRNSDVKKEVDAELSEDKADTKKNLRKRSPEVYSVEDVPRCTRSSCNVSVKLDEEITGNIVDVGRSKKNLRKRSPEVYSVEDVPCCTRSSCNVSVKLDEEMTGNIVDVGRSKKQRKEGKGGSVVEKEVNEEIERIPKQGITQGGSTTSLPDNEFVDNPIGRSICSSATLLEDGTSFTVVGKSAKGGEEVKDVVAGCGETKYAEVLSSTLLPPLCNKVSPDIELGEPDQKVVSCYMSKAASHSNGFINVASDIHSKVSKFSVESDLDYGYLAGIEEILDIEMENCFTVQGNTLNVQSALEECDAGKKIEALAGDSDSQPCEAGLEAITEILVSSTLSVAVNDGMETEGDKNDDELIRCFQLPVALLKLEDNEPSQSKIDLMSSKITEGVEEVVDNGDVPTLAMCFSGGEFLFPISSPEVPTTTGNEGSAKQVGIQNFPCFDGVMEVVDNGDVPTLATCLSGGEFLFPISSTEVPITMDNEGSAKQLGIEDFLCFDGVKEMVDNGDVPTLATCLSGVLFASVKEVVDNGDVPTLAMCLSGSEFLFPISDTEVSTMDNEGSAMQVGIQDFPCFDGVKEVVDDGDVHTLAMCLCGDEFLFPISTKILTIMDNEGSGVKEVVDNGDALTLATCLSEGEFLFPMSSTEVPSTMDNEGSAKQVGIQDFPCFDA